MLVPLTMPSVTSTLAIFDVMLENIPQTDPD